MKLLSFILLALGSAAIALDAVTITTAHFDNSRNGANTSETTITPALIAAGRFKKLGTYTVDGDLYAQPLYVPSIMVSGSLHNLIVATTLHNKVYAFDADLVGSSPLWTTDLGAQRLTGLDFLYSSNLGCLSTPAIDVAAAKIYVVCLDNVPNWTLRILSLTTGGVLSSVIIGGQVIGTGDTLGSPDSTSGPNLIFIPTLNLQRAALTLANGKVYVAFGSYDTHPYHGWIMAYDKTTLVQTAIMCTTPNSYGGAIWHTPGPAVDSNGNLYVATGNGRYDGVTEFGDSVLKLSPTLTILDTFTPNDQAALEADDVDVSSGGPILIPGTHLVEIAGKDFNVFVIDTNCMGFLQGSSACTLQAFITKSALFSGGTGSFGGMFMNGHLYLPVNNGNLYNFAFNSGTGLFNTTPTLSATTFASPGASQLAGSSNGVANGIIWVPTVATSAHTVLKPATLRAFDPMTSVELWNSDTSGTDTLGNLSKFASPLVANGRVYVDTNSGAIAVYGPTPGIIHLPMPGGPGALSAP